VSGDMPTNQRSSQMREFAESKGLMTNARCLTEGVDLPAIDCVVFTDPKKSKVDIVQAAGRALRLSPGKKFGYILIPLIIPENENATEAAKDTAFEEIVATIRALATQDTRIIEYLRAVSSGTIPKGGSPVDGITKINVLTKVNEEEFNKSIQLKVWDRVAFGNWRPYEEAKKFVQKLKFKNRKEWFLYTQSDGYPTDMPKSVETIYKNEWEGIGIFLGYKTTKFGEFVSYEKAKKFAKNKKIKSHAEWRVLTKSKNFPDNISKAPNYIYKEFEGWGKFLGTKNIRGKNNFLSYKDCKIYAKSLKLRTVTEWWNLRDRPQNVPQKPNYFYKNEWEGWSKFLGVKIVISKDKTKFYCTYLQAKKYAKSLKLKNVKEWNLFTRNKNFPAKIPKKPNRWFKNEWETWGIFLGTGTVSPNVKKNKFLNFKKAKAIVCKFNLKNEREWRVFTKTSVFKKLNIPVAADRHYANNGWNGYAYFLGNNINPRSRKN
jgi:hypothetical protein